MGTSTTLSGLLLLFGVVVAGTTAGCQCAGRVYPEGQAVPTDESCLSCRCVHGALVCWMRVCVHLPDSPPCGCVLLQRPGQCCAQLLCDYGGGTTGGGSQGYTALDGADVGKADHGGGTTGGGSQGYTALDGADVGKGCVANGTLYAEGSAMDSSSLCRYCYCIRGKERCVEPTCPLPVAGCRPHYRTHACCPTYYICSEAVTATTTLASAMATKTTTDFTGVADEKQGVTSEASIPGQFELENSASLAITNDMSSKDLERIEGNLVHSKPRSTIKDEMEQLGNVFIDKGRSHREMGGIENGTNTTVEYNNETVSDTTTTNTTDPTETTETVMTEMTTTEITTDLSAISTTDATTINWTKLTTTMAAESTDTTEQMTTESILANETDMHEQITTAENIIANNTEAPEKIPTVYTVNDSDKQNRIAATNTLINYINTQNQTSTKKSTFINDTDTQKKRTTNSSTVNDTVILQRTAVTEAVSPFEMDNNTSLEAADVTTEAAEEPITIQTETTFMTLMPTTVIMLEELDVVNVTVHSNVSIAEADKSSLAANESQLPVRAIPSDIEPILNITQKKDEDYEYDYNEPSLPPSLPGVRIIPFVAADAVKEDQSTATVLPKQEKHRPSDSPTFYKVSHTNFFSPPVETEGGFVPREPNLDAPFYESKFDVPYHTTGMNIPAAHIPLEITSGTIIPTAITILPKTEDDNGESPTVVLDRIDVTPHPQSLQQQSSHLGGIVLPITVADGVVTPDPFRDVIRTETAPDLPSLIGNIMPYLLERHASTSATPAAATTSFPTPTSLHTPISVEHTTDSLTGDEYSNKDVKRGEYDNEEEEDSGFFFDSVLQFLYSGDQNSTPATVILQPTNQPPTSTAHEDIVTMEAISAMTSTVEAPKVNTMQQLLELFNISLDVRGASSTPETADTGASSGLLKLAGCNIYGRMYRVGRIISELSGPCLECMCTEIGVQCRALDC